MSGLTIDRSASTTVRMPKRSNQIQFLSPDFFASKETETRLKPRNISQNPTNIAKNNTVIPGYLKRMNPINTSRIPHARYDPKLSMSERLEIAKITVNIPLTKIMALNRPVRPTKLSTGVRKSQNAARTKSIPVIRNTHQFFTEPATFEMRLDIIKGLRLEIKHISVPNKMARPSNISN